jgi:hypothetical protein
MLFDKINNSIYTTLGHPALISALGYLSTTRETEKDSKTPPNEIHW